MPRGRTIDEDILALQNDVNALNAKLDGERTALNDEIQRLSTVIADFHHRMAQILPGLTHGQRAAGDDAQVISME